MTEPKNLDEKVPVKFELNRKRGEETDSSKESCPHPFKLVKDGLDNLESGDKQRYKCNQCGSRLGNRDTIERVRKYKASAKELIYDFFFHEVPDFFHCR